jgi:hypothetical protein
MLLNRATRMDWLSLSQISWVAQDVMNSRNISGASLGFIGNVSRGKDGKNSKTRAGTGIVPAFSLLVQN